MHLYIYIWIYIYKCNIYILYIRYSGEKAKTTFLKNISTYCLPQFYYIYIYIYIYVFLFVWSMYK